MRPSELYGVNDQLAAFYFDRGIYWWGSFVEQRMDEAEAAVRKQMRGRSGTDTFVVSARINTYNKIFGLNPATAYRQPGPFVSAEPTENQDGAVDLGVFNKKDERTQ